MAGRVIAIGDVHGCATALSALVDALQVQPDDTIVTLGDYVDRGPDSKDVLEQLIGLAGRCRLVPILGNHEEMMLAVVSAGEPPQNWLQFGGVATLDSYGFCGDLKVIPAAHLEFLQGCRPYFETETHFFLHANFDPDLPLVELDRWTLRWKSLREGIPGPHQSGKIAIVGHTPSMYGEVLDVGHLKCIDTYCYGGRWLTALDVASGNLYQARPNGQTRVRPPQA